MSVSYYSGIQYWDKVQYVVIRVFPPILLFVFLTSKLHFAFSEEDKNSSITFCVIAVYFIVLGVL